MSVKCFSGPKLELEELDQENPEHVYFVYQTRRHPDVAKWLFGRPPGSLYSHKDWLARNVPSRRLMYAARGKDIGRLVGYCHAKPDGDWVELGFAVHPDFQGHGYGGDMVEALLAKVTREFPGKKVFLEVRADNERALRLYEKHGFVRSMVRMERP